MSPPSSHGSPASREPVSWRGQRVPNLLSRKLADGTLVFDFRGRINGSPPVRRRLRATTVGDAVREARQLGLGPDKTSSPRTASSLTVAEAATSWIDYLHSFVASAELAERTVALHEQRLRVRILPTLGHKPLATLATSHISEFMSQLRNTEVGPDTRRRPLGASTRRGYLATLESLLRWTTEQKLIPSSPADALPRREKPRNTRVRQPRRLNNHQVAELLDKLGPQFRPIGYVLAFQALRVSEALGLRWCDIDFNTHTLRVCGQLLDHRRIDRTKTPASTATIALLPAVARALRDWRARQAERDLNLIRPDALVFSTWNGQPQSRRNVHRAIRTAATNAGLHDDSTLPHVCPHDLRGSAGSNALPLLNGDLSRVSKHLRHANPNITARLYLDILEGDNQIGTDLARAGFGH